MLTSEQVAAEMLKCTKSRRNKHAVFYRADLMQTDQSTEHGEVTMMVDTHITFLSAGVHSYKHRALQYKDH